MKYLKVALVSAAQPLAQSATPAKVPLRGRMVLEQYDLEIERVYCAGGRVVGDLVGAAEEVTTFPKA